jgi:hypothetical protein
MLREEVAANDQHEATSNSRELQCKIKHKPEMRMPIVGWVEGWFKHSTPSVALETVCEH